MNEIAKLEAELQKKKMKNNLLEVINTFSLGVNELSKTVSRIFSAPSKWENQISRELEIYEEGIILERKK